MINMNEVDLNFLKDMVRIFKCKTDDIIFIYDGIIYCINSEKSLIKMYKPNKIIQSIINLNSTIHVAEAITSATDINNIPICIVDKTNNQYTYEMIVSNLFTMYARTIKLFIDEINQSSNIIIKESDNLVEDGYYRWIFDELFSFGTGYGDIVKSKNGNYKFTIYKGLIPYLKSDKLELYFHDIQGIAFYTNFRVIKKNGTLDVFTKNLRI